MDACSGLGTQATVTAATEYQIPGHQEVSSDSQTGFHGTPGVTRRGLVAKQGKDSGFSCAVWAGEVVLLSAHCGRVSSERTLLENTEKTWISTKSSVL